MEDTQELPEGFNAVLRDALQTNLTSIRTDLVQLKAVAPLLPKTIVPVPLNKQMARWSDAPVML
jgi:hypothetical protein